MGPTWLAHLFRPWRPDAAPRVRLAWLLPTAAALVSVAAALLAGLWLAPGRAFLASAPATSTVVTRVDLHAVPAAQVTGVSCTDCHWLAGPTSDQNSLLPAPSVREACLRCHPEQKQQLGMASVHPPFATGECTTCHRAHPQPGQASADPALLTMPTRQLCLICHADKREQQKLPYTHPPFASGECTSCHDPHASQTSPILRAPVKQLCFTCHQGEAQNLSLPVQHPPFAEGNCTSCHSPHASDQPEHLRAPLKELCFSCHASQIARMDVKHKPVQEGRCTSCHQPHGSRYQTLLRAPGDELCLTCHRK